MKRLRWVTILALVGLLAAACGDGEAEETTTTTAAATTEATEATTTTAGPAFDGLSVVAPDCDYGGNLKSIEAVDQYTVKFTLCATDVAFASKAAFTSLAILPQELLESSGGAPLDVAVGTGPYKLEAWDKGNQMVFTRNDGYWGDPAIAQTLVFRWSAEAAQRLVELQSGQVDGIDNVGTEDFDEVRNDSNLQLLERPGLNIFYLGLNRDIPPFDNEGVRQAIAMAIDKQRIVDNFYPKGSSIAEQFLPPDIFGYVDTVPWYDYDVEAAKQMLADAGFPDGFEVTLSYRDVVRGYLPNPGGVATDLQAQLAEIGITVNIEVMESGAFLDAADAGQLPMYLLGWGADYPDATNFYDFHFGGGASPQFGAKFDDLVKVLADAGSVADPAARLDLYTTAAELVKQYVPMVPVAHGGSGVAYRADVTGGQASPLGNEYMAVMDPGGRDTLVWMQNAEPISLYCADESDGESLRACEQIYEALLSYEIGGTAVEPALATEYTPNEDGTEWTFTLRQGVTFHDGSTFDANDVVASYAAQWDAANPLHVGRNGDFVYFTAFFGSFLNAPAS
jgi:ABC-type transport system substrate-binding protein